MTFELQCGICDATENLKKVKHGYWRCPKHIKIPETTQADVALNDLLSAKDLAIASLGKLQNEFEKLNIYSYAEMMEGLMKTVEGAVIIAKQARNL